MGLIHRGISGAALAVALLGSPALAQDASTLVETAVPIDYDRGRNVSVSERARPDYDPLGIRQGSVLIFPRLDLGLGASDNVFLVERNRAGDAFASLAPSVRARTDWSRNAVVLNAGGRFRRYFSYPRRNVDEWYVNSLGRLDFGSSMAITAESQIARFQEDPFASATEANIAALSSYRRTLAGLRGEYREGRVRGVLSADRQRYTFSELEQADGSIISQANRDRDINRITGQFEYAFSPSFAAYGQLSHIGIDYSTNLGPGFANRDSDGFRVIGGATFDVSGSYRGAIGMGYSQRDFESGLYRDVSGFSVEAKVEYFRSELTTFTITGRRAIEDSNLGVLSAFFDNRVGVRIDHELRRNVLLNGGVEYAKQDYIDSKRADNIWRVRGGARYLVSREIGIQADLSYANRRRTGDVNGYTIGELAGAVSLVLQR